MTTQLVEANVVLTADNSQYDQAMNASAGSTLSLGKAVDSVGQKISRLTKTAGKSLVGITAADVGLITGAVTAWASYEKQMSRLQAQSAILARTNNQQTQVMKDYTTAVKGLRTEYGTTTAEAAKLTETLSKLTNIRQTRDLTDLSKVFVEMSKATGESSEGLASSLVNLQKVMGSNVNPKTTRDYADMFTYLSAQTSTSTQGLIEFTAQLAPVGEAMGLNQKQVAGFATAFARAGQEGMGAATVFSKVTTDISKSLATGSSEVAHYANLVGVSQSKFRSLDEAEQIVRIFEALQAKGAGAATELERLGLEGPRSMKAIQSVIGQAGGVRQALGMAETGYDSDAVAKGSAAAMSGLTDEFDKLQETIKQTAEAFGTWLGPAMAGFLKGMNAVANVVQDIAEGPLGKFLQLVMGVVAPLAAGGGALLLFAGILLKVAAAFTLMRNSMTLGAREGFAGGPGMVLGPDGRYVARGEGKVLGPRGTDIARGGRWTQAGMYNIGQFGGAAVGGGLGAIREAWMSGREQFDPNYTRPAPRSPMSYMAGGLGRAMNLMLTPQFDQMRFRDPSKRDAVLGRFAEGPSPFGRIADFFGGKRDDPLGDAVRKIKTETEARADSTRVTRMNLDATRQQTEEVRKSAVGWRALAQGTYGVGRGMVGGAWGAGTTGARMLMNSPMGMPIAGMAGTAAVSGFGIESNMAMGAAMGLGFGPEGAVVGGAIGAGIDAATYNDKVADSIKNLGAAATDASKSGLGLAALDDAAGSTQTDLTELNKTLTEQVHLHDIIIHPRRYGASVKNSIEAFFGDSDIQELEKDHARAQRSLKNTEDSVRALAEATGTTFSGSRDNQLRQMEEFMATTGQGRLAEAGVTMTEFTAARKGGITGAFQNVARVARGDQPMTYQDMMERIATGLDQSVEARLERGGGTGQTMMRSDVAQRALRYEGNVQLFYQATNDVFDTAVTQGKSYLQIMREAEQAQHTITDENSRGYELQMAVAQKAQQAMEFQAPQIGRAAAFQQQLNIGQMLGGITPNTPEQAAQLEQSKAQTTAAVGDQISYLRQMLLAQNQYDLQRSRAQEDYHLQRTYQEYDFNLQRERAEENFQRMRNRAVADYGRQQRRAYFDFNLQRTRAEQDFNHQVAVQAKQAAQSVYDIYARVQTERTSSASWILANAQDQLTRMQEQASNLDELRARGLSTSAIQQLNLTDPQHAQQVASLMTELTPQMIRQFNRVAGTERTKAARELFTDPSSLEWREMQRGYRRSMRQGAEDFERQMRQSRQDFRRGLNQQQDDFEIMMGQQEEDYETGVNRQEKAYKKSMDRSAEDMKNMSNEILMSVEDVLTQSQERLTGAAGRQARQVARSLEDLKKSTKPEAIRLMKELAAIYGFEYTVPSSVTQNQGSGGLTGSPSPGAGGQGNPTLANSGAPSGVTGHHEGGTIPGWNPGRDTHTVAVGGGESIMRPEWTRAIGESTVRAMNHRAKYGGFAEGGVFWPVPGRDTGTYPGHDGVDINRGSGNDDMGDPIRAFRSGKITYVGWDHGYGNAIFQNTAAGNVVYGHTSAQYVHAGQRVKGGELIGAVGDTGNSTSAHLHFGIPGGTTAQALALLQGAMIGRFAGATPQSLGRLQDILKNRYPGPEKDAWNMQGVHMLQPGQISEVINRFSRRKINQLNRKYGMASTGEAGYDQIPPAPHDLTSNQEIVRRAMQEQGWHQWGSLYPLVMRESGFRSDAQNPSSSAYGMFQFLDGTWAGTGIAKTSNPWKQAVAGMRYIRDRYGDPQGAWNFWQDHNWYGNGAVFDKAQTIGVGEHGPEAVIPLNARGADFMTDVMGSVMGGRNVQATGRGMNVYNTRIDRSTNFTGPITVQANDPMELIGKLQARKRVMALSRPSLTGSAA